MSKIEQYFREAEHTWDLVNLYMDLSSAKDKRLTPMEKVHLRGLLNGHSPAEMAEILQKEIKGLEADLSSTIYRYVKILLGKKNTRVENWRNIAEWLEDAGYKYESSPSNTDGSSEQNTVNVTNIRFENNKIRMNVFLQITIPSSTDLSIQGLESFKFTQPLSELDDSQQD